MSDIDIKCKHCHEPIRDTSGMDANIPWVHEDSGNSGCDVHSPADAVMLMGVDINEAAPDLVQLAADTEAALDAKYHLSYISYDDQLNPKQIQVLLDGDNEWESDEFSRLEEWESENKWRQAREILQDLMGETAFELLDGANGEYIDNLRFAIEDRDESNVLTEMLNNTNQHLFRYDLDLDVPDWTMLQDTGERRQVYRDIAKAAGLNVFDRATLRTIRELVSESSYGGRLCIIWYDSPANAVKLAQNIGWKPVPKVDPATGASQDESEADLDPNGTVTFSGGVYLFIHDAWNGSGYTAKFDTVTAPWIPRKVRIDAKGIGGYSWTEIAGPYPPAYESTFTINYDRPPTGDRGDRIMTSPEPTAVQLTPQMDGELVKLSIDGIDRYTPLGAYSLWQNLQGFLSGHEWPKLTVVEIPNYSDPDGEPGHQFKCPHCGSTDDEVNAEDIAWRTTSLEPDFEDHTVFSNYDKTADYVGLLYSCLTCTKPVSLPEGWEER